MNVAGKSLQDIYDAGSKRLDELESSQKSALNDTAEAHLDERMQVEPESLKRLEERTVELESEIRSFLQRGLERVEKAVSGEGQESERHINRLVESLILLSKKFSESIAQLRSSAESELADLCADSKNGYENNSDLVLNKLREESTTALDAAQHAGSQSESTIIEHVESHWNTVYDSENEVADGIAEGFEENIEVVTAKTADSRKALEELVDQKLSTLEARLAQANESIRGTAEGVSEHSERHAFDADVRLKERFSSLLYEMASSFDDMAARAGSDMSALHESSMADLTMKTQELSRAMDSLAEEITSAAGRRSEKLQSTGSQMVTAYVDQLNERLDSNNVFLKEIEAERAQLVAEIWEELTEVKNKFEQKLGDLAKNTLDKMRTICEEAELAVSTAQQNCLSDSRNHANEKKEAVEKEARDFIARISSTKQAALDAIAKAAGATTSDAGSLDAADAEAGAPQSNGEPGGTDGAGGDSLAEGSSDGNQSKSAEPDVKSAEQEENKDDSQSNPKPGDTATGMESRKRRDKKAGKNSDKRSGDSNK